MYRQKKLEYQQRNINLKYEQQGNRTVTGVISKQNNSQMDEYYNQTYYQPMNLSMQSQNMTHSQSQKQNNLEYVIMNAQKELNQININKKSTPDTTAVSYQKSNSHNNTQLENQHFHPQSKNNSVLGSIDPNDNLEKLANKLNEIAKNLSSPDQKSLKLPNKMNEIRQQKLQNIQQLSKIQTSYEHNNQPSENKSQQLYPSKIVGQNQKSKQQQSQATNNNINNINNNKKQNSLILSQSQLQKKSTSKSMDIQQQQQQQRKSSQQQQQMLSQQQQQNGIGGGGQLISPSKIQIHQMKSPQKQQKVQQNPNGYVEQNVQKQKQGNKYIKAKRESQTQNRYLGNTSNNKQRIKNYSDFNIGNNHNNSELEHQQHNNNYTYYDYNRKNQSMSNNSLLMQNSDSQKNSMLLSSLSNHYKQPKEAKKPSSSQSSQMLNINLNKIKKDQQQYTAASKVQSQTNRIMSNSNNNTNRVQKKPAQTNRTPEMQNNKKGCKILFKCIDGSQISKKKPVGKSEPQMLEETQQFAPSMFLSKSNEKQGGSQHQNQNKKGNSSPIKQIKISQPVQQKQQQPQQQKQQQQSSQQLETELHILNQKLYDLQKDFRNTGTIFQNKSTKVQKQTEYQPQIRTELESSNTQRRNNPSVYQQQQQQQQYGLKHKHQSQESILSIQKENTVEQQEKQLSKYIQEQQQQQQLKQKNNQINKAWKHKLSFQAHRNAVSNIVYSSQNQSIITGGKDYFINAYSFSNSNTLDSNPLHSSKFHRRFISALAYSEELNIIASGSQDCSVKLLSENLENIYSFNENRSRINDLHFINNGIDLFSSSNDGSVFLYDLSHMKVKYNGNAKEKLVRNEPIVKSQKQSDKNIVIAKPNQLEFLVFGQTSKESQNKLDIEVEGQINNFQVMKNGYHILVQNDEGKLSFWDFRNMRQVVSTYQQEEEKSVDFLQYEQDKVLLCHNKCVSLYNLSSNTISKLIDIEDCIQLKERQNMTSIHLQNNSLFIGDNQGFFHQFCTQI